MVNFVFIAPPAAGKGTQSKFLVEKYGYKHISTGDLLREEVKKNTNLGIQIDKLISSGKLVDDNLIGTLLENYLSKIVESNNPFIIDGFPRTINQAKMLDNILEKLNVNNYKVINMNISLEDAEKRVLGRLICPKCGKSYNNLIDSLKPIKDNVCDVCSSDLSKRTDDTKETLDERYNLYMNNVLPIIDYYNDKNLLINIDATKNADDIFKDIETHVTRGETSD